MVCRIAAVHNAPHLIIIELKTRENKNMINIVNYRPVTRQSLHPIIIIKATHPGCSRPGPYRLQACPHRGLANQLTLWSQPELKPQLTSIILINNYNNNNRLVTQDLEHNVNRR